MAFVSGQRARALLGDYNFSVVTAQVSAPWQSDMLDVTTIADSAKAFIPGLDMSTATMSGWLDSAGAGSDGHFDQLADYKAAAAAEPFTFGYQGLALGDPVIMLGVNAASVEFGSQVADRVTYSLNMQTDGITDFGYSLKDLAAVTVDTNGSSLDNSASSVLGGAAHLHVTAYSGLTNAVVKVQHSTDNFGASIVDLVTFSTVTGITSQRSTVTGTVNRYLRYTVDVTGTGSITFAVAFARGLRT